MNVVAMSSMNLNHPEARFAGATCRVRESSNYFLNAIRGEGLRHGIAIRESNCARGHDILPAPLVFRNRSLTFPRPIGTGLASRMRQLHSGDTALFMNETDDPSQRFNVSVTPDTKVLWTDAAFGKNGRCLSQHQPSAAHRPAAQMDEMPIVGVAIAAGVLTHRRNEHAIGKLEISNRERIKKVSHSVYTASLNRFCRACRVASRSRARLPRESPGHKRDLAVQLFIFLSRQ